MKSFKFGAIPGDLIAEYPHPELSHCLSALSGFHTVLNLGSNHWLSNNSLPIDSEQTADLAMLNLSSALDLEDTLSILSRSLSKQGYFAMVFFHWPAMQQWLIYELRPELKSSDQELWISGQKVLNDFFEEGRVQVIEREVHQLAPDFLEGVDLLDLVRRHWLDRHHIVDQALLEDLSEILQDLNGFLERTNSNLDLSIESIFGIKEW